MDEVIILPSGCHVVVPLDTRIGHIITLNRESFNASEHPPEPGGCFAGRAYYIVSLELVEQIVQALSPNLTQ